MQRCQQILCASIRYRPGEKTESVSRSAAQKRPFRVAFHGLSARQLPEFHSFVIVPWQAPRILAVRRPSAAKEVRVSRSLERSILFAFSRNQPNCPAPNITGGSDYRNSPDQVRRQLCQSRHASTLVPSVLYWVWKVRADFQAPSPFCSPFHSGPEGHRRSRE